MNTHPRDLATSATIRTARRSSGENKSATLNHMNFEDLSLASIRLHFDSFSELSERLDFEIFAYVCLVFEARSGHFECNACKSGPHCTRFKHLFNAPLI